MIEVGDAAPDVTLSLPDRDVGLGAFRGHPLVLYFYPKDMTPGCTSEAIDFSRLAPRFAAAGATVIGVSRDPAASHAKFADRHGLVHALASDEDGSVCEAFGVWVENSLYGRRFMGIERATFLIDGAGRVARVWRKVKVKGHADAVLAAVDALEADDSTR